MSRLNFDVVRKGVWKSLSDGKSLYRKVLENLIINSMQEESSKTELWMIWYGIFKLHMSYELEQHRTIDCTGSLNWAIMNARI
jgi:hypothetical protein